MDFHILKFRDPPNCPIFNFIKDEIKVVEGRKNSKTYSIIKKDDIVYLQLSDPKKGILCCKVTYIHKYSDIKSYLEGEGLERALPCAKTIEEGIKIYESFVSNEEIKKLKEEFGYGFLGIGIKLIGIRNKHIVPITKTWYEKILDKTKTSEGRLNKGLFSKINQWDLILFVSGGQKLLTMVIEIKKYRYIEEMLKGEGLNQILPGIKDLKEGIKIYRQWYKEEDEEKYGVIAMRIKLSNNFYQKKYHKYKSKYNSLKKK